MPKTENKKTDTAEVNKEADAAAAAGAEVAKEGEGADEAAAGKKDTEIDLDAEIEAENRRGKPDASAAAASFKEREKKRKEDEAAAAAETDEDRPLTAKDLEAVEARVERKLLGTQALSIAKTLAASDKEAALVVARWKNRTFPEGTTLADQIEECYSGLPNVRKRLIGERNEALRALAGRDKAGKSAAGTHIDAPDPGEPKMSAIDAAAVKAAGYKWVGASKRYEKPLKNGSTLVKDPKTGATFIEPKQK